MYQDGAIRWIRIFHNRISCIYNATITLYFLQEILRSDLPSILLNESSTTHENVFLVSPPRNGSYLRYIERPTTDSPPFDFSPVINSSLDINQEKKKERIDTIADWGMTEERISSRSTNFGVKPTWLLTSPPFSTFSPPSVQLLLEFREEKMKVVNPESRSVLRMIPTVCPSSFKTRD